MKNFIFLTQKCFFIGNLLNFKLVALVVVVVGMGIGVWGQTTVTYVMQDAYFTTQVNDGGDFFNGTNELGMWANTGNKNTVAWRTFRIEGNNNASTARTLRVGDVFKITVSATRAFGQIGFSLNAAGTQGTTYANRISGSRLYCNTDNNGSWYVNRSSNTNQVIGSGYTPIQSTFKDYIFTIKITSSTTADVFLTVDGTDYRAYNLTMNGTGNIDAFSIYGSDLWDGDSNDNAYWKQTASVTNSGSVELGYYLTSGTYTPGLVSNGLAANSASTSSTNNVLIGGDAGSSVVLNQANTYTGTTTVNANATLKLGVSSTSSTTGPLGSTTGTTVSSGGVLDMNGFSLTSSATEVLTLNGTGISSGGALTNTSGTSSTWAGTIAMGSNSSTGGSGNLTISGILSGAFSLTKVGAGTLTLSNSSNSYSGGTVISGGTVSISNAGHLGNTSGAITLGSGSTSATLNITTGISRTVLNVTDGSSAGVINVASGQTFTLTNLNTASGTNNATKIGKSGSGTLTLSGAGTYVGQTQIGEGSVIVSNNAGLGTNNSTVARGIDLGLNVGDVSQANNVSVLATNGITLPQSIYVAPNTTSATRTIGLSGASGTATFNNEIYLDGNLTVTGTGTVVLSGRLTNTGGIISSATTVNLQHNSNNYSGTTTINSGSELRLNPSSNATFASQIVLNGGTLGTTGITATRTWTNSSTLNVTANSTIALLSGTSHTLTFSASNAVSWTAGATVNITGWSGNYDGTAGTGGRIFIGNSASGLTATQLSQITFFNGTNYYQAALLSSGELVPSSSIAPLYWGGSGIWTTANTWSATSGGTVNQSWATGRAAIFNVANSTITGGTTNVSSITANENVTFTAGGTLNTNGSQAVVFVANGKTFDFGTQSIGTTAGTGFIKNGPGIFAPGAAGAYPGGFTLNTGTVLVGGSNSLGTGVLTINGGVLLANSSTSRTPNVSGTIIGGDFQFGDATNYSGNTGNLIFSNAISLGNSSTRTITIGSTSTFNLNGVISGTSSNLVINATVAGTLSLGNTNTYTGYTRINGGTLTLGINNAIPVASTGGGVIFGGGTLNTGAARSVGVVNSTNMGTLTLLENSSLVFGSATTHNLYFAASDAVAWTAGKTLAITGWNGFGGSTGTGGKIFVGSSATGLTSSQLAQITINGQQVMQLSSGEIVPKLTMFRSKQNGTWSSTTTWETSSDDGATWADATVTPTNSYGTITIRNSHTVTLSSVITIDQVIIETGGVLNITATSLVVNDGSGDDIDVYGTLINTNPASFTLNGSSVIKVQDGGIYRHAGSAGSIPNVTWVSGSTCEVTGLISTMLSNGLNQNFSNFTWNCASQTTSLSLEPTTMAVGGLFKISSTGSGSGILTLGNGATSRSLTVGSLQVSGGTFAIAGASTSSTISMSLTVSNNCIIDGGSLQVSRTRVSSNSLIVNGTTTLSSGTFYIINSGSTFSNPYVNSASLIGDVIVNGGTLDLVPTTSDQGPGRIFLRGNLTLSSGSIQNTRNTDLGTTGIYFDGSSTQAFTHSGGTLSTATGGIGRRFYYKTTSGPTINEIYSASSAQTTVNGTEPSSLGVAGYDAWPTSGSVINNLTINNSSGVTLSTAKQVNGTLTLTNGKLTTNGNVLTLVNSSTGSSSSYVVADATGTVTMNAVSSAKTIPIGTATDYTPLTLSAGSSTNYSTYVTSTLPCAVGNANAVVNLAWNINGSNAPSNVVFQWNSGNQGSSFNPANTCEVGRYGSACPYTATSIGAASGSGPYTLSVSSGLASGNNIYSIGNINSIVPAGPTLNSSTLSSTLSTTYGTASSAVSFTASGTNLTANITATAQTGYEVSTDNTSFSSSVSVAHNTTVWVRLAATQAAGDFNGATAVVLSSTGATNVNVTTSASGNTVSQKALTIIDLTANNKVYDATTSVSITGTAAYSGLVNGESFSVSGAPTWAFATKTIGTAKAITQTGSFSAPSANYSITQPTYTADITTATITITGATASNKVYDGTTAATLTGGTLSGVLLGDVVTLTQSGTFASANVANGISVTSTSSISGTDAGNYTLTQPSGLTANITQASQTIVFGALANKITTDAPFACGATSATSGVNPLTYASSNPAVATINSSGVITIVGAGTTTITVSQAGNTNYSAAADVAQTLTVTQAPCGTETFSGLCISSCTPANTSYGIRTWTGVNGVTWTATDSRSDQTITTNAVTIRNGSITFGLTTSQQSSGIGDLTISAKAPFGSPDIGTLQLSINGSVISSKTTTGSTTSSVVTYTWSGINITNISSIVLAQTTTGSRITIDDISWSCYNAPEINLKQASTNIASGTGSYSFGTITTGNSSSAITFTVENNGNQSLNLSGTPKIAVSGTNAADFTVDQTSTSSTVSAGANTSFTITFSPSVAGSRTATISVANNDSDENPYTFSVSGIGNLPTAPEINVKQASTDIASGGGYAFGSVLASSSSSEITFTIENTGNADLNLTATPKIAISGTNAAEFSINQSATATPVAQSSSTTFTVTFSPTSTGAKSATITISNDDVDEGTYTIALSGTGAMATQPTNQPTGFTLTTVSTTTMSIGWTAATGSPDGYLVLRTTASGASYPSTDPVDGTAYIVGNTLGNATVEYIGSSLSTAISSLAAGSQYNYEIYSYNGSGNSINYLVTSPLQGQPYTLSTEPNAHAASFTATATSATNINLAFSASSTLPSTGYLLLKKTAPFVSGDYPVDGNAYGVGSAVGSNGATVNTVVTSNSTTSSTGTGVAADNTYYYLLVPYNGSIGGTRNYYTGGTIPTATATTPSSNSDAVVVSSSESATISSLMNDVAPLTSLTGVQVWQFTIRDGGSGLNDNDALSTKISSIVLTENVSSTVSSWNTSIKSVALFDGSTLVASGTVGNPTNNITFSGLSLSIPDGQSKTFSLRLSLNNTLGATDDGKKFVFNLTNTNLSAVSDGTSSGVASFASINSSTTANVISVVATKLAFVQQPPSSANISAAMSPAVTVDAEDANGNRDLDYVTSVSIVSTGTLSSSPQATTPSAGLATFSDITHTAVATGRHLTATSGSLTSAVSNTFDVILAPVTIYQHNFGTTTISSHPYTVTPTTLDVNLSNSSWSNNGNSWVNFAGSSGQALALSGVSSAGTWTLTFDVAAGYNASITSFSFWRQTSNSVNVNSITINGTTVSSGTITSPTSGTTTGSLNVANTISNLTGTITVVLNVSGSGSFRLDDFTLLGNVTCLTPSDRTVAAVSSTICNGLSTNISVSTSQLGVNYQLRNNSDNSNIGSPVSGTGGTINLSTGNLTSATTFNVLATSTCGLTQTMSVTPTVSINSNPSAPTGSAAQTLCSGTTLAELSAIGTAPQWYSASTGGSALSSSTALVNSTTYHATQTVNGCESTTRLAVTVTLNSSGTWIGGTSTDWSNTANWCGGVPTSATNVTIPSGTTNSAMISSSVSVNSLTINSGATVSTSGSPTITISNNGSFTNNGTFTAGTSKVSFAGNGTVSGTVGYNNVDIAGGVNFGSASTINGTLSINSGGYINTNAPIYGIGSTLKYNSGGAQAYGRSLEWSATSGQGAPYSVQVSNSTTLNYPNTANSGANAFSTNLNLLGDLTVDNGSNLYMDWGGNSNKSGRLDVAGNVLLNGNLSLGNASGGDIKVGGNWTRNSGSTFTPNGRAVFFTGTGTSAIIGNGGETFTYLVNDKTSGSIQLGSNLTLTSPSGGNALSHKSTAMLDLNGFDIIFSGPATTTILANGASSISGSGNMFITNNLKTLTQSSGSWNFGSSVVLRLENGLNFGNNVSTINGTLEINLGGFVSDFAPNYASGSILKYNSGTTYGRNVEWYSDFSSGTGVPANVLVSSNTILNLGANNNAGLESTITGNLTLDGTLSMAATAQFAPLNVLGNVVFNGGGLTLSTSAGGDIKVGGNWSGTGTFTPNSRAVFFNGTGNQTISRNDNFPYLFINKASGILTFAGSITLNNKLTYSNGTMSFSGGSIDASGASAEVEFANSGAYTLPTGLFSGNVNKLTLNGSGGITLSENVTVSNSLKLTSGVITLDSRNLTLSGSLDATDNGGTTAYINTSGSGAFIRSISTTGVDYKFPVGLSSYAPISVNFTGGTVASSSLASRAVSGNHPNSTDGAYIRTNLYWEMNQTGMTNPQYNMSFTYPGTTNGGGSTETEDNLLPAKWSASTGWLSSGSCSICTSGSTLGTSTLNIATKTITWSGVTGFSDFGGFGQGNGSPLPVELLSFNGTCNEGMVDLLWQTASEFNSSHFDVEKSTDGETWRVLATIPSAGTSNELLTYQTVDNNGTQGNNYYRLRQVDIDGEEKLYDPINVSCVETTAGYFTSYPNPSGNEFQVVVNNKEILGACTLNIADAQGKVIDQRSIEVKDGINMFVISEKLTPGIYFLNITNRTKSTQVIKHAVK